MKCPKCGNHLTVIETRAESDAVYRKRKCKICGKTAFTSECEDSKELFCQARQKYKAEIQRKKRKQ